jgi:hypothetical protein
MSDPARQYRGTAAACREVAATVKSAAARGELFMLALKYDGLARHAEALAARTSAVAELRSGYESTPALRSPADARHHA